MNFKLLVRLVIGLLQGITLFLLKQALLNNIAPFSNPFLFNSLGCVLIFIPPVVVLGWGNIRAKILILWSLSAAVLLYLFTTYCVRYSFISNTFVICIFTFLFIAYSLVTAAAQEGRIRVQYPLYFDVSWKLTVQVVLAGLFTGFLWLVLFLGSYLFILLGSHAFLHLILESWFAIPLTTFAFNAALHLTDVRVNWVRGIRTLLLTLFSWLLPIITLILIGFFIFLIKSGMEVFRQQDHGLLVLMFSISLLILLINTVYQDGNPKRQGPLVLQVFLKIAMGLPVFLVALSGYFLIKQIGADGWTDTYILTVAYLLIMTVYALGYLATLFFSSNGLILLESVNFYTAWLILFVIVALLTPIANPHHLLHAKPNSPKIQPLTQKNLLKIKNINAHTTSKKLPDSFVNTDWSSKNLNSRWEILPGCLTVGDLYCDAWEVQFDHTGRPGILIFGENKFYGFIEAAPKDWEVLGTWESLPLNCTSAPDQARAGKFQFIPPEPQIYPDIQVQDQRLRFAPRYQPPKCT